MTPSRPRVFGPLARNEVLEFETATDVSALFKERPFDFTVSQSFTASMVKLEAVRRSQRVALLRLQWIGTPAFAPLLGHADLLAHVGAHGRRGQFHRPLLGRAVLVASLKWDYLRKYTEFGVFGGLRIEGSWSKAWEGRSGRERSLTMFAGLAAHAVFLSEKGLKGLSKPEPHGAEINFQLGFRFGPWGKRE